MFRVNKEESGHNHTTCATTKIEMLILTLRNIACVFWLNDNVHILILCSLTYFQLLFVGGENFIKETFQI